MKRLIQLAIPGVLLTLGLLLNSTESFAKKEYTASEKKPCTACHTKAGAKDLNDAGKYYAEHKTLKGYTEKK